MLVTMDHCKKETIFDFSLKCLQTGSDGNGYVLTLDTKEIILIECGINYLAYRNEINWQNVKAIFITHYHTDHIGYLDTIIKKFPTIPIFMSSGTKDWYLKNTNVNKIIVNNLLNTPININNFSFETFKTSHDTENPIGYIFKYKDKQIFFITDTGVIPNDLIDKKIENSLVLLESNYDDSIIIKNLNLTHNIRTMSNLGHLSTKQSKKFILDKGNSNYYLLIHGSKNNLDMHSDNIYLPLKDKGFNIHRFLKNEIFVW